MVDTPEQCRAFLVQQRTCRVSELHKRHATRGPAPAVASGLPLRDVTAAENEIQLFEKRVENFRTHFNEMARQAKHAYMPYTPSGFTKMPEGDRVSWAEALQKLCDTLDEKAAWLSDNRDAYIMLWEKVGRPIGQAEAEAMWPGWYCDKAKELNDRMRRLAARWWWC